MSNHLAIATVSATLRKLLFDIINADMSGAQVTTVSPNIKGTGGVPSKGINIFLFRVSPNEALSNLDMPTRGRNGTVIARPQVALDLEYLLSFYGNESVLEPQQLLGITTRALRTKPQLNAAMINSAITDPTYSTALGSSDLAQYIEAVKFIPMEMSLEEMSKLWSVYFQTPYALSIAYKASVVLIDGKPTPNPPIPVRDYGFFAFPMNKPVIDKVQAIPAANDFIVQGGQVRLTGINFFMENMQTALEVGGSKVTPSKLQANLTEFTVPTGLTAGVQGLQIHHAFMQGVPQEPHRAISSDLAAFVLHPLITKQGSNYDITVSNVQGTGSTPRSADISVKIQPAAKDTQRLTIELIDASNNQIRTYNATSNNHATGEIVYAISDIPAGDYLVRVRVDGAESAFDSDMSTHLPIAPEVNIP
jgi:hypothetical protein